MWALERRWRKRIPEALRRAAPAGSATCMFWPTAVAGAQEVAAEGAAHVGLWARVRQWPVVRPIRLAIRVRLPARLKYRECFRV